MKIYLVGGAVRDSLLELPITERDWLVVGATVKDMLIAGYQQVGKNFPVFLHPQTLEEYALARIENKSGKGYTGFTCYTSPKVTIEEDLFRRDLTINAMARDLCGDLIDPYNGLQDINNRILRHVSDHFKDDPLRILRVARFAARFASLNFTVAPETIALMQQMTDELSLLSPERVWKETAKALITPDPQIFFQILRQCGALKIWFPEVDCLFGIPHLAKWHKYKIIDTGIHTMISIARIAKISDDLIVRFTTLCHDFGKNINSNHLVDGLKLVDNFCQRLRIPNTLCKFAKCFVTYQSCLHDVDQLTPATLIQLFNSIDIWRYPERLEKMISISEAEVRGWIGMENQSFNHGNLIRQAYSIISAITSRQVVADGFIGSNIRKELCDRRKYALANWIQQHPM